jgi:hypothetical protein
MSWGTTSSELKTNYPDIEWETETEGNVKIFKTEGLVGA